ncbi:unnamed protein product [Penicillium pancosmium]
MVRFCSLQLLDLSTSEEMNHLAQIDFVSDDDIHAAWQESSNVPAVPPCLATDRRGLKQTSFNLSGVSSSEVYGLSLVDCVFYPNHETQQSFPWTGPDPLSPSTKAEDIFVYFSAFLLSEEVYWVEFRLSRFDSLSDELIGEHLFFLPRIETAMGNLSRVRKQILDIISQRRQPVSDSRCGPAWNLFLTLSTS